MNFKRVIGIGWDVGGWMGNNHGVAACEWHSHHRSFQWIGKPTQISIPFGTILSIDDLTSSVCREFDLKDSDNTLVVVGVDAPLGFPVDFKRLISGESVSAVKPEKEIYNHLAYRYTDQEIYRLFGKKPLSASFDRIGNNATLAMLHTRKWKEDYNYKVYPFDEPNSGDNRIVIEVYPALVKTKRVSVAINGIKRHLPEIEAGTDAYDACICALYALAFGTNGALLPLLKNPPNADAIKEEGWIYHFNSDGIDFLKSCNFDDSSS